MKKTFERFDMTSDPIRTRWYLKPVTKMALATEELYFHYRRQSGKPCSPGLA